MDRRGLVVGTGLCLQLPIRPSRKALGRDPCRIGGQQLLYSAEHAAAGQGHGSQIQELPQPLTVDGRAHAAVGKKPLDLGGKIEITPLTGIEKRLYAQAVPCQKHPPLGRIVHGKRKDAVAVPRALLPVKNIAPQHHLGVALGAKRRPPCRQCTPQFGGIVKLPVINDGVWVNLT